MKTILVTGPDGYIGGRLIPRLLAKGYIVRCLARNPEDLSGRPWAGSVRIFKGDVYKNEGLEAALAGTDAAYYLIHSMADVPGFEMMEASALDFSRAASAPAAAGSSISAGLARMKTNCPNISSRVTAWGRSCVLPDPRSRNSGPP